MDTSSMKHDELYDFVSAVSGDAFLRVEENLGDGYVRLRISEAEKRQAQHDIRCVEDVVIELLRNARDAAAKRIFVATQREGDKRSLTFIDDGQGIPASMHEQIFEPRVTSKLETMVIDQWGVHGRGMALYSIRSNAQNAQIASSASGLGTSIVIDIDLVDLGERADQSTWPCLVRDEDGVQRISNGPHNTLRRVLEFALENRGVDVYLGSPTEIAATLFASAKRELRPSDLLFCDDPGKLPVHQRFAAAADSREFVDIAAELGLQVSERTAHRILNGEIREISPALGKLLGERRQTQEHPETDIYRDRRGLKLHQEDVEEFSRALERAFEVIADKYYLTLSDVPKVTVGKDRIRVSFEVEKEV